MKALKLVTPTRSVKEARVYRVLLGLVAHYIQTGRPVGSHALKEAGFEDLSSATLRNYFSQLEEEGYLQQMHASGGRIPTDKAYRFYAQEIFAAGNFPDTTGVPLVSPEEGHAREISRFLQETSEALSQYCGMAVFLSAPRFDQDYVTDIKIVTIDPHRCLCVLVTDFGVIQTATLHSPEKLNSFSAKRLESYFQWRLGAREKPTNLEVNEERLAQNFYNEVMVRYMVRYTNFTDEDIHRTGFSRLLTYPEFAEIEVLSNTLALFENVHSMRLLLRDCMSHDQMRFWIGSELGQVVSVTTPAAVIAIPYRIHQTAAGALGVLGPARMPYDKLFATLQRFSQEISDTLTQSVYKFKITVRQPTSTTLKLPNSDKLLLAHPGKILLENKSTKTKKS